MIKKAKYLLVCFIFLACTLNGQNYKTLKGKDTVYFYFDYSKQLEKRIMSINSVTKDTSYVHIYNENNPNKRIQRSFLLIKSRYVSFEDMDIDKQADIKTITRRFLRKNKAIVIYPKDLEGDKMKKVLDSRSLKIVVYIIDVAEKKKRKFVAHEVRLSDTPFIEI
ncbi:hypothetical protein GCM10022291_25390 [Postechiella marina]|uniref:Lipoprotein n=1 Tax=Postechiella marina TaxID=943941 RepID=A0ABP8CCU4_9FLAO